MKVCQCSFSKGEKCYYFAMEKKNEGLSENDHRILGQKLDLFSFHDVAPGAPFWHPKGMVIFRELEKYAREVNDSESYEEINTPILVKKEVFERSGHWEFYRNNMFWFQNPMDENEVLVVKPMNCPESTYVYNSHVRSYRELPVRLAEFGRLHRNELSGTLGGLMRVRQITMDDAHIFVTPEGAEEELVRVIKIINDFYKLLGFSPTYVLATRPEKALGEKEQWEKAQAALSGALKECGLDFETAEGEGAFYGPKIEVHFKDNQGRDWQMGTAQLDLVMLPEKFDLAYVDDKGERKKPWVIHRALFGSFERFIGMLLEHTEGTLPLWLSPVQVRILNIGEAHIAFATEVTELLKKSGVRAELNASNETLGKKIRDGKTQKIPYLLVIGDKEVESKTVTIESTTGSEKEAAPETLRDRLLSDIKNRKN